jgi:hypothetical protein
MAVLKKTPEERAAQEAHKREQQDQKEQQRRENAFQQAWASFWASPAGQARLAFANGGRVFQYSLDVMNQRAIIIAMWGSRTSRSQAADATDVLNSVSREGWELVNGDFVFVMTGQESRDKLLASGQNVAVAGTVMGYYLFKRNDSLREVEADDVLRQRLWDAVTQGGA